MKWPRYPASKSSGIDWIGELPEHWSVRRLTQLAKLESGHTPSRNIPAYWDNCTIPWVSLSDAHQFRDTYLRSIQVTEEKISELGMRNSAARLLPTDTVVLSRTASVGYAVKLGRPMATTQDFANWICGKELDPDFLLSCLWGMKGEFERLRYGSTHSTIYMPDIRSFAVPHPPLEEQKKIASFLDRELTKISDLIDKQRRLIELLEEKRRAVMARAVTKGLNLNVPMKPSRVDWLGAIPKHWQVVPLRYIASEYCDGPFGSGLKTEHYVDQGVRVIRLQNIRAGGFNDGDAAFIDHSYFVTELKRHEVLPDDVLIAGLGDDRNVVGRACIAPKTVGAAIVKADCFRFRLKADRAVPAFVAAQLTAGSEQAAGVLATGSTRSRIPLSAMASRKIALPSVAEQVAICNQLELLMAPLRSAMEVTERSLWLLEESRNSLIASAVTGKIDVRGLPVTASRQDRARFRVLVAAEITHRHLGLQRFGRVKLQKLLYLAEAHAGIHELQGNYFREAAGPLDSGMIADAERGMISSEYFDAKPPGVSGDGVSYAPLGKAGRHMTELAGLLGSRATALARIVELIRDLDTRAAEAIATIYAVWNDALLDGENPGDDRIVRAFLNDWHSEKRQKFKEADVRHWLDWMKRNGVVPAGTGPRTIGTVPRDMFHDL